MGYATKWAEQNLSSKTNLELAEALAEKEENHTHFYALAAAQEAGADLLEMHNQEDHEKMLREAARSNRETQAWCAEVAGWIRAELKIREENRLQELRAQARDCMALAQGARAGGNLALAERLYDLAHEIAREGDDITIEDEDAAYNATPVHDPDLEPFCECPDCTKKLKEL